MNGLTMMMCPAIGALVIAAAGGIVGPPPADDTTATATRQAQVFVAREIEIVETPKGRWEAILHPVGTLSIVGDESGLRVQLNNKPLSPDRIAWQSDNFLMIFDEARRRQFQVKLGEGSKIEAVRPGTWLDFRAVNPPRVAIGVYTAPLTPALATQLGLDLDAGLLVTSVVEDMPAFKSGVQQFDVITAVDETDRISDALLKQVVASKDAGETIQLHMIRRAQPVTLEVAVEAVKPLEPGENFFGLSVFNGEWADADIVFDPTAAPAGIDPVFGMPKDENTLIRIDRDGSKAMILPSQIIQRNLTVGESFTGSLRATGRTGYRGDVSSLEQKIEVLTTRIANLEALITRLLGEGTAADDAVELHDQP